jgi:hypothetical protein
LNGIEPAYPVFATIALTAGMAVANTIAIGISAQRISVAWLEVNVGGQSRSDLRNVTMETIIVANTATAIAANRPTIISMWFTGRTPPNE